MSMMFAALKRMESPGDQARAAHMPAAARAAPHWLLPAVCGGALVAVAGLAWLGMRSGGAGAPVEVAAPAPAVVPAVAVATPPPPAPARESVQESVRQPIPESVPETVPEPMVGHVAQPAMSPVPERAPEAPPAIVVRDAREVADAGEAPGDAAIARHVATIGAAVRNGDLDDAQAGVDALAAILPPRSLTLLRMQAWVAHQRGDTANALSLYRSIVDRVPSDQTAVINLAILEAAHGQAASARQRLQHLRQADGTSRAVEDAIALVEASLR